MRLLIKSLCIVGLIAIPAGCVKRGADWPVAAGISSQVNSPREAKFSGRIVTKDETLSGIARQYGVDARELARVNKLDESCVVKEGSRLIIPKRLFKQSEDKIAKREPTVEKEDPSDTKLSWPVSGKIVQKFGMGDAVHRNGITIESENGAEVKSAAAGKVGHAGEIPGLGKVVLIDHSDRLVSVYAHLNTIAVTAGENVSRNQAIGSLVRSRKTKRPTLYFEVRSHAKPTNPLKLLGPRS
ncbi:MAG: murein hydrolase activator EnvC family protein [Desulfomonilaceae bacterium]